jgi:hypothetical protein
MYSANLSIQPLNPNFPRKVSSPFFWLGNFCPSLLQRCFQGQQMDKKSENERQKFSQNKGNG